MLKVSFSVFRTSNATKVAQLLPALVLKDEEPFFFICDPKDVIFIGDMHPRIQREFKSREAFIRRGMPPSPYLGWEDLKRAEATAKSEVEAQSEVVDANESEESTS